MASSGNPGQFPVFRTRLFGRAEDILRVSELLHDDRVRLVTLTGTAGVGKTRLAVQVALESPLPSRFVDLSAVIHPDQVPSAISRALQLRESAHESLMDQLGLALDQRPMLLVMDNFEHLLAAVPLVGELLGRAPALKMIITSRAPSRIDGEIIYPVLPLPVTPSTSSPAVALFVDRVKAASPEFSPGELEIPYVAAICESLDGVPLSVELAAARVPALPLLALRDRVERLLPLLSEGPRDAPARQQSMASAIAWSYRLLQPEHQALFRRLSVFHGGWSESLAVAVCGVNGATARSVREGLAALVAASLVHESAAFGEDMRYRMLETVREFAAAELSGSAEEEQVLSRFAAIIRDLTVEAFEQIVNASPDQKKRSTTWLDNERQNILAAFRHFERIGSSEDALLTITSLSEHNYIRGFLQEDHNYLSRALAIPGARVSAGKAHALARLAIVHWAWGDLETSEQYALQSLAVAKEAGAVEISALAQNCLVEIHLIAGRYEQTVELGLQTIELLRESGPLYELLLCINNTGFAAGVVGNVALSSTLYQEGMSLCRSTGNNLILGLMLRNQGVLYHSRGQYRQAARALEESLEYLVLARDRWNIARTLAALACVASTQGEHHFAAQLLGAAETRRVISGTMYHGPERKHVERATNQIIQAIGSSLYQASFHDGRGMSIDDAVNMIRGRRSGSVAARNDSRSSHALSPREIDVLRLMSRMTDKQIAAELLISHRTVTTHVSNILVKMKAMSRTEAVTLALRKGIITLPASDRPLDDRINSA